MFNFISGDLVFISIENDLCATTKMLAPLITTVFARFYIKYQNELVGLSRSMKIATKKKRVPNLNSCCTNNK